MESPEKSFMPQWLKKIDIDKEFEKHERGELDYIHIESGPPSHAPLEEHRRWIQDLQKFPKNHPEVLRALKWAYERMDESERYRAANERKTK
jgi:hypothetical protein